jgi:hypothetical protein
VLSFGLFVSSSGFLVASTSSFIVKLIVDLRLPIF